MYTENLWFLQRNYAITMTKIRYLYDQVSERGKKMLQHQDGNQSKSQA